MFGWKKKYNILDEKFNLLKEDFDSYKKNVDLRNNELKNLKETNSKLVSENKKLMRGYTSLLKLYGIKHHSFSIPYIVNLYNKYDSHYCDSPRMVELVIPQIRFVADESLFDEAGISLDEE